MPGQVKHRPPGLCVQRTCCPLEIVGFQQSTVPLGAQTEGLCSKAKQNFGPAGFEPTTCRRGDRSTKSTRQVRRGLAPS